MWIINRLFWEIRKSENYDYFGEYKGGIIVGKECENNRGWFCEWIE